MFKEFVSPAMYSFSSVKLTQKSFGGDCGLIERTIAVTRLRQPRHICWHPKPTIGPEQVQHRSFGSIVTVPFLRRVPHINARSLIGQILRHSRFIDWPVTPLGAIFRAFFRIAA